MASKRRIRRQGRPAKVQLAELLLKYRNDRGKSQGELAKSAGLSQSYVAMLEKAGCDPPKMERRDKLMNALDLKPYEEERFIFAAAGLLDEYEPFLPIKPDDVAIEVLDFSMVWIVGGIPIEFSKRYRDNFYRSLLNSVSNGRTQFIYWLPEKKDIVDEFDNLRKKLEKDKVPRTRLVNSLECIIASSVLCLHQFALYDPLKAERTGRLGVPDKHGDVIGAIPMSKYYSDQVFSFLERAYADLRTKKKTEIEGSKFVKHYP